MNRLIRKTTAFLIATALLLTGMALPAKASDESTDYYGAVWYSYYDDSNTDVDIRFYKEPTVPMVFTCGSWSYTHPYHYNSMVVDREKDYYFGSGIHILNETNFKNGTDLILQSYPVPEGFEALNPPKIVRNVADQNGERQVVFNIVLKKKGEKILLNKLGLNIQVEKYTDGNTVWPYTGKPVCPKVLRAWTVAGSIPLTQGVDYTVSYEDNIQPGHPIIKINGIGKYSGSTSYHYRYQIWDYGTAAGNQSADGENIITPSGRYTAISETTGAVAFTGVSTGGTSCTIPDKIKVNGKKYKVTAVADKAFYNNKQIKSVTIGKNITKIGKNAFSGSSVTKLTVKSKKLTKKSVKGSLKNSKIKTIKVKVGNKKLNKQYIKKYKKIFTKKNAGRKVKIK